MKKGTALHNDDVSRIEILAIRDSAETSSQGVKDLFEWWASFAPRLPGRKDFDILDHAQNAANIFLIEVIGKGAYKFRVCGEEVIQIVGVNNNGNRFEYIDGPVDDREKGCNELIDYYDKIVAGKSCNMCRGNVQSIRRYVGDFESIDCPLVDEKGDVSHIVGTIGILPN